MQCFLESQCMQDNIMPIIEGIDMLQRPNPYTGNPISIFLLHAEVGMGKTYLISEYVKTKGILQSGSPSFAFIHEYDKNIYHYDLYLKNNNDFRMRLLESLSRDGLHFVEWGDKALMSSLCNMGFSCVLIQILPQENARIYKFFA